MCVRGRQFGMPQSLVGFLGLCFLCGVKKHYLEIMVDVSVFDTSTFKQLSSHWSSAAACWPGEVKKGKGKFAGVVVKHVCVGDFVQSKLGGKDLCFDSYGSIKLLQYGDFSKGGVVR